MQRGYYIPYKGDDYAGIFRNYNKITTSLEKLIKINASSTVKDQAYNILYPFINNGSVRQSWLSYDEPNSSISIKFIDHKMSVASYSLQSRYGWPVSWDVEALNNIGIWEIVSRVTNNQSLKNDAISHWETTNQNFFSAFRIIQTDKRQLSDGSLDDYFEFMLIEFFGTLIRNKICTVKINRSMNKHITAIFLLIFS